MGGYFICIYFSKEIKMKKIWELSSDLEWDSFGFQHHFYSLKLYLCIDK